MPPQISLSTLYEIKDKKKNSKHKIFDSIIQKCHNKITKIAQQGGMTIFYEIPYIIIGMPLYNINDCIEYVVDALRNNGLLVNILPYPSNNIIYISWSPADVKMKGKLLKNI